MGMAKNIPLLLCQKMKMESKAHVKWIDHKRVTRVRENAVQLTIGVIRCYAVCTIF